MIDYSYILSKKFKDDEWTLNGDDYANLVWLSDSPKPTQIELDSLWPIVLQEVQTEKENAENRKKALLEKLGITEDEAKLLLG